ncbi:MAG: hypothetical protein FJY77_03430, partial [Candidatus Altiarchaeales archaeon]|nr:hypothetical protein [Candidatus Altiarchaeales archaeon]
MKGKQLALLTSPTLKGLSRIFLNIGNLLSKMFPYMELTLKQAGITEDYELNSRGYFALTLTASLLVFLLTTTSIAVVFMAGKKPDYMTSSIIGIIVGLVVFIYMTAYPTSIVNKRVKYVERNLLFALRSILVQIRSGVPIFNSFVSIANGDYGPISTELKAL